MWTGFWSKTIPKTWSLYLWGHHLSLHCLHTNIHSLDLHRQATNIHWPRSCNCNRGWQILNLAYTNSIPLCHSPVTGPFPADSEFNPSNASEYNCSSILPTPSLLGFCIQVEVGQCWSCFVHWYIILVECDLAWCVHDVLSDLSEVPCFFLE